MSDRPTGTVTFLFTDIEGSTRLWDDRPDEMRIALARHDDLLRRTIAANHGFVFKTIGDAFCAAFAIAADALAAALKSQQELQSERWPGPIPLRVRMALHTGAAEARDDDYFGPPLNHLARLLAIGHGGQVLLSRATQELARDVLAPEASLHDLGIHRLRDLTRPEHVFQLAHPDLRHAFPPLRSLDNPELPNNLPQQVSSFIGRGAEIQELKTLLQKTRLLTLTGTGGAGKTRLSLQVAADRLDDYPHGVWFIELASLSDPSLLPQAVAQAVGIREQPDQDRTRAVIDHLRSRQALLVLDNCEHLLPSCARLVDALLRACPYVRLLASSREALGVDGEIVYRVPSLSLPPPDHATAAATAALLTQYESVSLFIERATAAQPAFHVDDRNAPAVAQICYRLDGIPLAIELAAARVRSLTAEEINARLDDRFRLLTGGSRAALPRQQTLRALIDWSYDLLDVPARTLFARLSVFAGGWTLDAAEAVCAGDGIESWDVLDLLTSLVDKSLVLAEATPDGTTRYRYLSTVRQYAQDRLLDAGAAETVPTRRRHEHYYLDLADTASSKLAGPEQAAWLDRLESEHDNLRSALDWNREEPDRAATGLRLAAALWRFWIFRGYLSEGWDRLTAALANAWRESAGDEDGDLAAVRAAALAALGEIAVSQGEYPEAQRCGAEALSLARALDDRRLEATALRVLGMSAGYAADYAAAEATLNEALTAARAARDEQLAAGVRIHLGRIAYLQGHYAAAHAPLDAALSAYRAAGDRRGTAQALYHQGQVAQRTGDFARAGALYRESLGAAREVADRVGTIDALLSCGSVSYRLNDHAAAETALTEALRLAQEIGARSTVNTALLQLGNLELVRSRFGAARAHYERALEMARELGNPHSQSVSLGNLGLVALWQEDFPAARRYHQESLEVARAIGDRDGILTELHNLGTLALKLGDYDAASAALKESLAISEEIGSAWRAALTRTDLADIGVRREDFGEARRLLAAALPVLYRVGDAQSIGSALLVAARIAAAQQRPRRAAILLGVLDQLRNRLGSSLAPGREEVQHSVIAAVRSGLGEADFAAALNAGATMPLDRAVEIALSDDDRA